jgi:hypothetical protein
MAWAVSSDLSNLGMYLSLPEAMKILQLTGQPQPTNPVTAAKVVQALAQNEHDVSALLGHKLLSTAATSF